VLGLRVIHAAAWCLGCSLTPLALSAQPIRESQDVDAQLAGEASPAEDFGQCQSCGTTMRTKWGPGRFCNRSCCNRFSVTTGNQGKARAQHPEAEGFAEQASEAAGSNVVPAELLVAVGLTPPDPRRACQGRKRGTALWQDFVSQSAAAEFWGIDAAAVSKVIRGRQAHTKDYEFRDSPQVCTSRRPAANHHRPY
jgi:hypothetical protein